LEYQNLEVIMAKKDKELMVPDELVMNKIYFIRGQKVIQAAQRGCSQKCRPLPRRFYV